MLTAASEGPELSIRLAKATDLQLLICLEHGVWGATRNRLQKWRPGDQLVIIGECDYCGISNVTSQAFTSEDLIFDGGFYPYRVSIDLTYIVGPGNIAVLTTEIRKVMAERYGGRYGWPILMQLALPNDVGDAILSAVRSHPNVLLETKRHLGRYLDIARSKSRSNQAMRS